MRTNKFSIGGLRGVYVSSIGNWGYEANFKAVYFFLRKDSARIKTLTNKKPTNKTKTSKQKNNKGDNFLRAQFSKRVKVACFTFGAFYALKIFSWKKKKKNRFKIISVTSTTYTTIIHRNSTSLIHCKLIWKLLRGFYLFYAAYFYCETTKLEGQGSSI